VWPGLVQRGVYGRHGHDVGGDVGREGDDSRWTHVPKSKTALEWLDTLLTVRKQRRRAASRDPRVNVFSRVLIARAARIIMVPCIVMLLLAPVILCNYLYSLTARLYTIVFAASFFIAVLSGSTRAKATELVIAGAT
jgi:hypothetical protein